MITHSIPLRELEATFVRSVDERTSEYVGIENAQGVQFLCPLCFKNNGGAVGTHLVQCWSRSKGVPDDKRPGPGRWTLHGTSIDDLRLEGDPVGGARSIQLKGGCGWHGFINDGKAEW